MLMASGGAWPARAGDPFPNPAGHERAEPMTLRCDFCGQQGSALMLRRKLERLLVGACGCAILLFMSGCAGTYTGGGFITSAAGSPDKANFGFNAHAEDLD